MHPIVEDQENRYTIEIQIEKQARRFEAYLVARDWQGEGIAQTDSMSFNKDGIDLAQIEKARIALDRRLGSVGYRRGRRQGK